MSCPDAANKRWRLGHRGIPLCDELKSRVYSYVTGAGANGVVIAHCRGDRLINEARLATTLGATEKVVEVPASTLEAATQMAYGTVNPFIGWRSRSRLVTPIGEIVQVFDAQVLDEVGVPGTMMTNAFERTWAVEFHVREVLRRLDHVVGEISEPNPKVAPRPYSIVNPQTIGILTGNAPESGILLWQYVNRRVRDIMGDACLGDVSMPRMIVHSLPEMGETMELGKRSRDVWKAIAVGIENLCASGADLLSVACNTTQYFTEGIRELADRRGAEFLSIPETVASYLAEKKIKRVGLLGIRYVIDLDHWSAFGRALSGVDIELPTAAQQLITEEIAYKVKTDGPSGRPASRLHMLLKDMEAQDVILGLTELSMLTHFVRRAPKDLIDPLWLLGDALASRFLGVDFRPAVGVCDINS
jgi:aspartate/glutamate racemase/prolyl-tRNA editing enzyme YbaK/EbsC (Cys-tRNA(Pro) deacylase)